MAAITDKITGRESGSGLLGLRGRGHAGRSEGPMDQSPAVDRSNTQPVVWRRNVQICTDRSCRRVKAVAHVSRPVLRLPAPACRWQIPGPQKAGQTASQIMTLERTMFPPRAESAERVYVKTDIAPENYSKR